MYISGASGFYLLSFLRIYAGHTWVGPCTAVDNQYASKWAPHSYL